MRTTVTIDDHVMEEAKVLAAREHRPVGSVVEDALRTLLERARQAECAPTEIDLPAFGDPQDRLLVDILDKDALAEALGNNEAR